MLYVLLILAARTLRTAKFCIHPASRTGLSSPDCTSRAARGTGRPLRAPSCRPPLFAHQHGMKDVRKPAAPPLTSPISIALICILPALDVVKMAYIYTAVPLHFVDQGWPLVELGVLLSLCYVPRLLASFATAQLGDWLGVPCTALGVAASVIMFLMPFNRTAVFIGCLGCSMAVMNQAHRGLIFRRFGADEDQLRRAMRTFTFFDVVGYSLGALLGGVLYDEGTFVAVKPRPSERNVCPPQHPYSYVAMFDGACWRSVPGSSSSSSAPNAHSPCCCPRRGKPLQRVCERRLASR